MENDIHELGLHESVNVQIGGDNYKVIRVHNGWIYETERGNKLCQVFVPSK